MDFNILFNVMVFLYIQDKIYFNSFIFNYNNLHYMMALNNNFLDILILLVIINNSFIIMFQMVYIFIMFFLFQVH